jgi:hydroxymethylpyrimidine pyrophosphatase-like HAD family hydrolase
MMHAKFGLDVDADNARFVFVGDSPNDQPMFKHFTNSIGVANVNDFISQLESPPKFVATQRSGQGFVEVVDAVLGQLSPISPR